MSKSNYNAWNIEPIDPAKSSKKDLYLNLVSWAILAASSHNVQPWRFILRPEENIIDVCLHESGILPASDKKARQAFISIGCAVENLLLAGEHYGITPKAEYICKIYPDPTVRLSFPQLQSGESRSDKSKKLLDAMKSRRMNRHKFNPMRPVPEDVINEIKKTAWDLGLVLDTVTDSATRFAIAEIQYTANKAVVARTDFRKELGLFMSPNDTNEGRVMPGNTFGLSDEMANKIHRELNKDGAFDPDLAFGFAASDRDGIKSSPLIGVISVNEDRPEFWIKAGRAFQKIALVAEINNLNIAVHAAIVEVEMFNKLLKLRLRRRERPAVIFRMGYAIKDAPHSPRVNIESVVECK